MSKDFETVICIESGQGFVQGKQYAGIGWNNGHHIFRCGEKGDPIEILLHDYSGVLQNGEWDGSHELAPADGDEAPRFLVLEYESK